MTLIMKKILIIAAAFLALTACVKDEMYKGPSSIDKVVFTPEAPTSISDVVVTATVSGLQKVTAATLKYNGTEVAMSGSGNSYSATIPAQADGTNVEKAQLLYDEIDRNPLFVGTAAKEDRSIMNVCFVMAPGYENLQDEFMAFAKERGMVGIKGHRSVGGFRASIYNACPKEAVEALIACMQEFEKLHK